MTTITRHPAPTTPDAQGYILDDEGVKYIAIAFPDGDLRFSRLNEGNIILTPSLIQAIQTLAIAHDIIPPPDPLDAEIVAALTVARDTLTGVEINGGQFNPHTLDYINALLKRMNQ